MLKQTVWAYSKKSFRRVHRTNLSHYKYPKPETNHQPFMNCIQTGNRYPLWIRKLWKRLWLEQIKPVPACTSGKVIKFFLKWAKSVNPARKAFTFGCFFLFPTVGWSLLQKTCMQTKNMIETHSSNAKKIGIDHLDHDELDDGKRMVIVVNWRPEDRLQSLKAQEL